ncbi:pPIWI_RE_Y domain-containing protein [Streptomyces antibioticus]
MTEDERRGVDLLVAVARGVIELGSAARASAFRLPYPPVLQLALDRMVLAGLTQGTPVPHGVPDLLSWIRERGPETLPLALPRDFLTAEARLIHPAGGEATRTCAELASYGPHGVLEQEAAALMAELADACGTEERFETCRDFLISRPVILRYDPVQLMRPAVAMTWRFVKGLYAPVPDRFAADGVLYRCTGCLLLAKLLASGGRWCEGGCPAHDGELESSHQPEQALVLPLSLRIFLALPGRAERAVRSRLSERVRLIPRGLGLHCITSGDGTLRTYQVHDREQPVLAALRAAETDARLGEPLDIVVPDELVASPGYRESFNRALPAGARVHLLSVSEFTALPPVDQERGSHA